jgi:hypothetical protein
MRYFAIVIGFLLLLVMPFMATAQNFSEKSSNGFNVESGTATSEKFTVEGKSFDVFVTSNGSKYIKAIATSGNPYPVWVHSATSGNFKGNTVYKSKKGSYCYYTLGKNGFPTPRWLEETQ